MQAGEISPVELFLQAGPVVKAVIIMLIAASLWCWIIIFEALWTLGRLRRAIRSEGKSRGRMGELIGKIFSAGREEAFEAQVSAAESDRRSAITAAMKRRAQELVESCQRGLPNLAVIASVAPFVGLFGTVWGIMEALKGISAAGSASLETVAGPIGAALVATGVGIAVAVPAVLVYNYFLRRLKLTAADLDDFAHDFYSLAQKSAFRVLVHPAVNKAQAGFTQPVKEAS